MKYFELFLLMTHIVKILLSHILYCGVFTRVLPVRLLSILVRKLPP